MIIQFLKCGLFVFLIAVIPVLATAQQEDTSAVQLNPVTISATLQPVPASRTGRNIIVIPGAYFSRLPVHSVDELLRYVPGLEMQMRGPAGSQSDIVLRGGTFQQVLIVLDGIRLNDPNTGHFNSYIPVVPAEIERIEVLKGASSAIYGSEAVGGVIHIITKSFAAKRQLNDLQLGASLVTGEYGLLNASGGGMWQRGNTAISGGVLSNNADGQSLRGAKGFYHNHTASLSFKQFIGEKWTIAARSSFDERKFAAQNFYTTYISDTADEKVTGSWNQLHVGFQQGRHNLSLNAGYKHVRDIYHYNPHSTANDNRSSLWQLLLTEHYHLYSNSILTLGLHYQNRSIQSNDRGNHSLEQIAGFIMLNQKLNNFSFSPSLRIDYNERRGTEWVPQINLSYVMEQMQLRASAGKTIRDADFTERYNNYNKASVSSGSIGNPSLKAEKSFSYEVGADYFVSNSCKISVTAFQRQQSELIDWVTTPYALMPRKDNLVPAGTYALATNISSVNTSGVEADIQYNVLLQNKSRILSAAGLIWLNSKSSEAAPSFYISSHARFLTNINTEYLHNRFSLGITAIYKDRKSSEAPSINAKVTKSYVVVNARASVFFFHQKMALLIEVDNVLDENYSDLLGSKLPGRWLMAGMKWKL